MRAKDPGSSYPMVDAPASLRNAQTFGAVAMIAMVFTFLSVAVSGSCLPGLSTDTISYCGDGIVDPTNGEECDHGGATEKWCSSDCRVECSEGVRVGENCYFPGAPASQQGLGSAIATAEQNCQSRGGRLVKFGRLQEWEAVSAALDAGTVFWMGLSGRVSRWDFPDGGNGVADALPVAAKFSFESTSDDHEPGAASDCSGCFSLPIVRGSGAEAGAQLCLRAEVGKDRWTTTTCMTGLTSPGDARIGSRGYCQRKPVGRRSWHCGEGATCFTTSATFGRKTYVLRAQETTDSLAPQQCSELGGELVVIESAEEREQVWTEILQLTARATAFWLGLYYDTSEGVGRWRWGRAKREDIPSMWGTDQPREAAEFDLFAGPRAYASLENQGSDEQLARNSRSNFRRLPSLCELPPHPVLWQLPTTTSTALSR